ncbi:AGR041Cp [Eremothecium gossypii ATCC 10895]|uniref:AGR041Cp n=1 Tax=Eremothecium gossypii (strain ATCC 10895 / CBS 109.51 / FGSC 9923 / NRRL Y-1056) TaxID=284811 RepID=Q750B6_EREGS|nr:AGR041Cp [Eremothecium gossypii ATCC 10895]AAS54530.1 AGR041Cp [Eremothecium gossypii ATCC 10895]AEY98862.1 FAGR041Cp [Eremothecium gossypii FDAG1]
MLPAPVFQTIRAAAVAPALLLPATRALSSACTPRSWLSRLLYPPGRPGASSYRDNNSSGGNQCLLPIRSNAELNDALLISHSAPLLLNFTFRGVPQADALTGAANRIVLLETDKRINIADVEADFADTREGMLRFGVNSLPTLVAVRKTLPVDYYTLSEDELAEVNWLRLKAWIERNADDW